MDRAIVYPGQVPLDTDSLRAGRYDKIALGRLIEQVYGASTPAAMGFGVTFSSTALTVTVARGAVLASGVIDQTAIGGVSGGLAADTTSLAGQYLLAAATSLTLTADGVAYTLYAVCSEADTDLTVLPFYNSADPSQTLAGSANTGASLPTRRTGQVTLTLATSAPTTPAGGAVVALGTITVPSGASSAASATWTQASNLFWLTIPELQAQLNAQQTGRLLGLYTFTTSAYYTPSAGARLLRVRGCAGGGGGGAAASAGAGEGSAGSGGGAGAGIEFWIYTSSLGAAVQLVVGAGGAGAPVNSTTGVAGSTGGTSSFGSIVSLAGGAGGYSVYENSNSNLYIYTGGAGGAPTINDPSILYNVIPHTGGLGTFSVMQGTYAEWPGAGGASIFGSGGAINSDAAGGAAYSYGAGGSGAGANNAHSFAGGSGGNGVWIIEEYS